MTDETRIKSEPDDDLLMSYLNEDCLSTDPILPFDPPSPPYSTSSANTASPPMHPPNDFLAEFLANHGIPSAGNGGWPVDTIMTAPQTFSPELLHNSPFLHTLDKSPTPHRRLSAMPILAPKPSAVKIELDLCSTSMTFAPLSECDLSSGSVSPTESPSQPQELSLLPEPQQQTTSEPDRQHQPQQQQHQQQQHLIQPQEQEQLSASAKRQQRLIKNRAAALLSRKRKREYLNSLEESRAQLLAENETLKLTIKSLEDKVTRLAKENTDLKQDTKPAPVTTATSKTNVVFMIILFSFALFSFPSQRTTTNSLTVGGYASSFVRKQTFPMITSGDENSMSSPPSANTDDTPLPLEPVKPRDLQTWILKNLNPQEARHEMGLVHWQDRQDSPRSPATHAYLYADEFVRVSPLNTSFPPEPVSNAEDNPHSPWPTLSILSPLNKTLGCVDQRYLQIDVQVLDSHIVRGQLHHCMPATSDRLDVTQANMSRTMTDQRLGKDLRRKAVDKARSRTAARVIVQQPHDNE